MTCFPTVIEVTHIFFKYREGVLQEKEFSMELLNRIEHPDYLSYPTNRTVCVFDTIEEAEDAILALERLGYREDDMRVFEGEEGRDALDVDGSKHSVVPKFMRAAEKFFETGEWDLVKAADQELKEGHLIFSVLTPEENLREAAVETLRKHGGHTIKYFSRYYVEHLDDEAGPRGGGGL
jgi:hypothetical protein